MRVVIDSLESRPVSGFAAYKPFGTAVVLLAF